MQGYGRTEWDVMRLCEMGYLRTEGCAEDVAASFVSRG